MKLTTIQSRIYEFRGQQVMLDYDLAELYGTESKRLKEAVRRNISRFPTDFMFQLSDKEFESLRTQFASSNRGGIRYAPFAFTEQGVAMLSSVLRSEKAIEANIAIMRTFVFMRQFALSHKELTKKLKELESHYNKQFKDVYEALAFLIQKSQQEKEQQQRNRIGYKK